MNRFIIDRDDTFLLLIDMQEKLFRAMESKVQEMLKKNCSILLKTAAEFKMPVIVTEQYRKGLGETIPELAESCEGAPNLEKLFFDCMKDDEIRKTVTSSGKKTAILAGIESHICVFQTALTLLASGYRVVIANDAVGSRRKGDWKAAMEALAAAGAVIYPAETIAFIIIEKAGTPGFKALSPLFR
ncbi:MAG TPA: isochorismatase family protein [Spirochaetota bacterium]|nr:isochorismatase family protein [Spirochaetota bacterium]